MRQLDFRENQISNTVNIKKTSKKPNIVKIIKKTHAKRRSFRFQDFLDTC